MGIILILPHSVFRRILILILLAAACIGISAQNITTTMTSRYQVIDGFGSFYNPSASDTAFAHYIFEESWDCQS